MTKQTMIATGHKTPGQSDYTITADMLRLTLDARNWATCRALGIILPSLEQGSAQHAQLVAAAKCAGAAGATMKRIQRKRTKGWKMPPDAVYVGRPTKWGNPYVVGQKIGTLPEVFTREYRGTDIGDTIVDSRQAVDMYEAWLKMVMRWFPNRYRLEDLRGHDLACWCRPGDPCHADVLLELANKVQP